MNRTGLDMASISAITGFAVFLVIDAEPVLWTIAAASVVKVLAAPVWAEQALDLDHLFASPQGNDLVQHVLVVRTTQEDTIALSTRHGLRLESFALIDLLPVPELVFGAGYSRAATKHLILREDARPLAVLDVDTLRELARSLGKKTDPIPNLGETAS